MGTLFNQPTRNFQRVTTENVLSLIEDIKTVSKKSGLDINQVIKVYELAEHDRQNSLYYANGDIFDEQMSGFGELIRQLPTEISVLLNLNNRSSD